MAESDEGKGSTRRITKKAVVKETVSTEAPAAAETASESSEDRQAQVRERLQKMGVMREPGDAGDAAKNNNTTTGAAKMATTKREKNKDKSFWTQILVGLAVVVSLFLFIRSIAHHAPEEMGQQAASTPSAPADASGHAATVMMAQQPVAAAQQPTPAVSSEAPAEEQKPANNWLGALFNGKDKENAAEEGRAEATPEAAAATAAQQGGADQPPAWAQARLDRIDALREQMRAEMRALQEDERKRMDEQRKADMPVWMRGHVDRMEVLREEMRKEMDAMHRSFREHSMEQAAPTSPMAPPQAAAPAQEQVTPPGYYQGPAPWGYGYPYPPQGGNR